MDSVRTDHLIAHCETSARTRVITRNVGTTIDEPVERGGTNSAPSPTETFMASLLGCTNVIAHNIAKKMGIEISALSIDLEYDFHFLGARLQQEIDLPFSEVRLRISLESAATTEEIARLRDDLRRFCPVTKMILKAGTRIVESWNVTRPPSR